MRSATSAVRWRGERSEVPVFGTIASRFNDDGVTALYQRLRSALGLAPGVLAPVDTDVSTGSTVVVPPARERYLAEIGETVRGYHAETAERVADPRRRQHLLTANEVLGVDVTEHVAARDPLLDEWPDIVAGNRGEGAANPSRGPSCREWRCPGSRTTASWCGSCATRTSPAASRSPPGSSPSSARTKIPRGCSRAKAVRLEPTTDSISWPRANRRPGSRPRSIRSRCTASTPTSAPTSTARSGTRACRSRRSTT